MDKKYDFIVASIKNPNFSAADFKDVLDMNLQNTQMLSEDQYLNSNFIKENPLFQDSSGNFSRDKFSEFYRQTLRNFSEFSTESSLDNYQYGLFDTFRKAQDKVRPFGMMFEEVHNPERVSTGVVGVNRVGPRTMSDRELAQTQKVLNHATGQYEDYTPNDIALTSNPFAWIVSQFKDPLVLATYDENGEHFDPILGRTVEHQKGQKKLNDQGLPFYETLDGRSVGHKDVLGFTDNLTVDGSWLNKYDFFDSDSLDKSVTGTIMKNLAIIAPAFIPGIGIYYGGTLVVRELAKSLPMLYGMAGIFDNEVHSSSALNTIAAYATKFSGSTTDYAKENMFSFENFGNLVSDVVLQWQQQQAVIQGIQKLTKANQATLATAEAKALSLYEKEGNVALTQMERGEISGARLKELINVENREGFDRVIQAARESGSKEWQQSLFGNTAMRKYLEPAQEMINKRTKIAQDLSLGYMAIISNTDVYQDALDHGAGGREAAMLALGSTVGMWSVDKYLGLGEIFYDPAKKAEQATFRAAILGETKGLTEQLSHLAPERVVRTVEQAVEDKQGLGKYFVKGLQAGRKAVENYHSAIKEGTLGFFGKALGEGLEEVSEELVTDVVKHLGEIAGQYGAGPTDLGAWDNMKDRYLMSFLGGSIGGGIFALKDGNFKARQASGELLLLLRQGKGQEIRDELAKLHKKGELGSTTLSYKTEQTEDDKGNKQDVFLTADEHNQSQNDYAYQVLTQAIEQIETILQKNHLNKTEDELFSDLVLQDENYLRMASYLQDKSYLSGYQRRYQQLTKNIVAQQMHIDQLKSSDSEARSNSVELQRAEEDLNNMLLERDKFFNGDYSLDYLQKMLFVINPKLSGAFVPVTKEQFSEAEWGIAYSDVTGGLKESIDKDYEQYVKDPNKLQNYLDVSFRKFQQLLPEMLPIMEEFTIASDEWERIRKLVESEGIMKPEDELGFNDMLPGEDEESESFVNRNTQQEGESVLDFRKRQQARAESIATENARRKIQKLQAVIDQAKWDSSIRGGMLDLDPNTKRFLQAYLAKTSDQIRTGIISGIAGINIDKTLLASAEDLDLLTQKVRESLEVKIRKQVEDNVRDMLQTLDYEGLNRFYAGLGPKFTLKQFMETHKPYEGVANMSESVMYEFEDMVGDANGLDLYQKLQEYEQVKAQHEASTDEEEQKELQTKLQELENTEFDAINEDYVNTLIQNQLNDEMTRIEPQLESISKALSSDPELQAAKDLENRLSTEESPALELVKKLAPKIGSSAVDIEKALESIHKQFMENEKPTDFTLSSDQMKYLEDAKQLIGIVRAMVAAGSRPAKYGDEDAIYDDGMTYNKAVNKFYHDHKAKQPKSEFFKNFEDLYEIDEHRGNQLILSLDSYIDEINEWQILSRTNQANSIVNLMAADKALREAKINFLSTSTLEYLSDNLVNIKDPTALYQLEKLFHDNVKQAIAEGKDIKEIFTDILANLNNDEKILSGITTNIDENTKQLSAYDQYMYLVSLIATDPTEQLKKEKAFLEANEEIASLATQQPGMQLGTALATDPEVINGALDALQELATKNGMTMPVMYNTTIITGLGGAGKTTVLAKYLADKNEATWVVGPTSKQAETLKTLVPTAQAFDVRQLLTKIVGAELAGKLMDQPKTLATSHTKGGLDNQDTLILKGITDDQYLVDGAPKHIIIDEATHVNNVALQALSKWARKAGVKITLLGDENQRGVDTGTVSNLARETLLGFRTPRLNFSLRNASIWKVQNQNTLVALMDKIRGSDKTTTAEVQRQVTEKLQKGLNLSFYENDNTLEGDKVVSKLTSEDIHKLQGDIAYIGNDESKIAFIRNNLAEGATLDVLSKDEVQGREFEYVIVDSDWDGHTSDYNKSLDKSLDLLRSLYTMISRSKRGSIVLDNGIVVKKNSEGETISGIVTPVKEEYTTVYQKLSPGVAKTFSKQRLAYIDSILETLEPEEVTVEEEEKKEEEEKDENLEDERRAVDFNVTPEQKQEAQDDNIPEPETVPYRAYGNVQFRGNVQEGANKEWIPMGGTARDLGIFLPNSEGVLARTREEKRALVSDLNYLKSLFLYDLDPDLYTLPSSLQRIINKEKLKDAQFWLVAEDQDKDNLHHLIGMTNLDNDKTAFMSGKVISIQARFQNSAGKNVIVTLGTVANPQTWIDGIEKNKNLTPEQKEKQKKQAEIYEKKLKDLITGSEQEIRINKPTFTGRTELVPITDSKGKKISVRLEDLESDTSIFDTMAGSSIVSAPYILTKPIPGISEDLVGHAVMLVSNNGTLNPEQLGNMFIRQQEDRMAGRESKAQVRMIVLDNAGVSFHSLYRKGFKDIYRTSTGKNELVFPFKLEPMGIRMFASLWNYRADLDRFLKKVGEFKTLHGLSDVQFIQLTKDDAELYAQLMKEKKEALLASMSEDQKKEVAEGKRRIQVYASDSEFENWLDSNSSLDKVKVRNAKMIRGFNKGLDIPRFRAGWSQRTGAYIRKIEGIKADNGFYKHIKNFDPNDVNGIYINPDLAYQYMEMLDDIFENVIGKIFDITQLHKQDRVNYKVTKKWLKEARGGALTINEDGDQITVPAQDKLKALPLIMSYVAHMLHVKGHFGRDAFLEGYKKGKYRITLGGNGTEEINYLGIDEHLVANVGGTEVKGLLPESASNLGVIGQLEYLYEDDNSTSFVDARMDNFFNLIFHGVPFEYEYNQFEKNPPGWLVNTDALFKYGFFSDPVLVSTGDPEGFFASTATNRKLFMVDVVPGNPILEFTFDKVTEAPPAPVVLPAEQHPLIKQVKDKLGIDTSTWDVSDLSEDELVEFVKQQAIDYNAKLFNKENPDLSKMVYEVDDTITLVTESVLYGNDLKNVVSIEPDGTGNQFVVTNSNGKKFKITRWKTIAGVNIEEVTPENTSLVYEGNDVVKAINNAISLEDEDGDRKVWADAYEAWTEDQEGIQFNSKDLQNMKRQLRTTLEEEGIENDDMTKIENAIDNLINQENPSDCVVGKH